MQDLAQVLFICNKTQFHLKYNSLCFFFFKIFQINNDFQNNPDHVYV